jgi:hypothetical protein
MAALCLLVAIIGGVVVDDLVLENPAPLRGANRAARLRGDPDRLRRFTDERARQRQREDHVRRSRTA